VGKARICLVVGTRPQIIKSSPILEALRKNREIDVQLVHTGQHYDYNLSKIFFEQMDIMKPTVNLNIGSGTHVWQISQIMSALETVLPSLMPDIIVVPGDTNSALASALVAVKYKIKLAHIESGARSYDLNTPEEINRRLIDHCSNLLFTPSRNCLLNLKSERVLGDIHMTGDTMYDLFLANHNMIGKNRIAEKLGVKDENFIVATIHRTENVDQRSNLTSIMKILKEITKSGIKVILPMHPHTRAKLKEFELSGDVITIIDPLGYHDMLALVRDSKLVLTDSGGLQKEAFWLGIPCITMRNHTEWTELVTLRANFVLGLKREAILKQIDRIINDKTYYKRLRYLKNPFGDGKASEKIASLLFHKIN
jgi:UDP-N-acetylglucosamine 2-epimerase